MGPNEMEDGLLLGGTGGESRLRVCSVAEDRRLAQCSPCRDPNSDQNACHLLRRGLRRQLRLQNEVP